MTQDLAAVPDEGDEEDVDIDLDEIDEQLRNESVGKPTKIRINGQVLHLQHAGDWSSSAMRAMGAADWDTWAAEVLANEDELRIWEDANLRNYQMEKVALECARKARMDRGKSRRQSGSSRNGRRR